MSKRKNNILFYIGSLAGGGAERVLIEVLNNLNRNDFKISLALHRLEGEYYSELPTDINIIDLSHLKGRINLINRTRSIGNVIKENDIDLVVGFLHGANRSLMRARLFSISGFKSIITEHNNPSVKIENTLKFPRNKIHILEIKLLYKLADQIITVSEGIEDEFFKEWNIKKDNLSVIHNPVDFEKVNEKAKEQIQLPWDKSDNFKNIIAIGRLVSQKGYHDLINVFKKVREEIPSKLIILGKGPLEEDIRQQIKENQLEEEVYMPGFVENPWAFISNSDLYLSTSYWEGFHMTIVESMACGVPPIATDCDYGPREIITDGVNGVLVPVGDINVISSEVIKLLRHNDMYDKLSKQAKQRAKDFDVSIITKKYENLFSKILR